MSKLELIIRRSIYRLGEWLHRKTGGNSCHDGWRVAHYLCGLAKGIKPCCIQHFLKERTPEWYDTPERRELEETHAIAGENNWPWWVLIRARGWKDMGRDCYETREYQYVCCPNHYRDNQYPVVVIDKD